MHDVACAWLRTAALVLAATTVSCSSGKPPSEVPNSPARSAAARGAAPETTGAGPSHTDTSGQILGEIDAATLPFGQSAARPGRVSGAVTQATDPPGSDAEAGGAQPPRLPPRTAGPGVYLDSLGPVVIANTGDSRLAFRPLGAVMRSGDEQVVARRAPANSGRAGRTFAADAYGAGLDLRVRMDGDGTLVRIVQLRHPVAIPPEAVHVDLRESLSFDPDLRLFDADGPIEVGTPRRTAGWLSLRDASGSEVAHIPTASAWDSGGGEVPWMSFEVALSSPGRAHLSTRVPAAWLRDPARRWPVNIDPSVAPSAPPPIVASFLMAPVTSGSLRASIAATFTNFYDGTFRVSASWGDGATESAELPGTAHLFHEYGAPGVYNVQFQACDHAEPAHCARVERWVPAGGGDCDSLDDECRDFSFDRNLGRCVVVSRAGAACAACSDAALECGAGEFCSTADATCTEDCNHPGANACDLGSICDANGACVPADDPCAEGVQDCVDTASCVVTVDAFLCLCPGDQLGDGRSGGTGCSRYKAGAVLSAGGTSAHQTSPTAIRVRGSLGAQATTGVSEGASIRVRGGLGPVLGD